MFLPFFPSWTLLLDKNVEQNRSFLHNEICRLKQLNDALLVLDDAGKVSVLVFLIVTCSYVLD